MCHQALCYLPEILNLYKHLSPVSADPDKWLGLGLRILSISFHFRVLALLNLIHSCPTILEQVQLPRHAKLKCLSALYAKKKLSLFNGPISQSTSSFCKKFTPVYFTFCINLFPILRPHPAGGETEPQPLLRFSPSFPRFCHSPAVLYSIRGLCTWSSVHRCHLLQRGPLRSKGSWQLQGHIWDAGIPPHLRTSGPSLSGACLLLSRAAKKPCKGPLHS